MIVRTLLVITFLALVGLLAAGLVADCQVGVVDPVLGPPYCGHPRLTV